MKKVHVGFDDLPELAAKEEDPKRALDHVRRVRDGIRAYVARLAGGLESAR